MRARAESRGSRPVRSGSRGGDARVEIRVLRTAEALAAARARLATMWRRSSVCLGTRTLGYPGGRLDARIYWSQKHRIWASFPPLGRASKYWNALGVDDPHGAEILEITAEVSTPV